MKVLHQIMYIKVGPSSLRHVQAEYKIKYLMCQVLFYKYFEVSKNIYFEDHLRTAASEL